MCRVQTVLIVTQNYVKTGQAADPPLSTLHPTSLTASSLKSVCHSWRRPRTGILFKQDIRHYVSPEAVAATEFHEMLSGRQRREDVKLEEPSHQQHPKDGDGVGYRNVGEPHLDAAVWQTAA